MTEALLAAREVLGRSWSGDHRIARCGPLHVRSALIGSAIRYVRWYHFRGHRDFLIGNGSLAFLVMDATTIPSTLSLLRLWTVT